MLLPLLTCFSQKMPQPSDRAAPVSSEGYQVMFGNIHYVICARIVILPEA